MGERLSPATRSLPSRERGLKWAGMRRHAGIYWSLPSRERGLKYPLGDAYRAQAWSLPSRERGLKFNIFDILAEVTGRSLHGSVD